MEPSAGVIGGAPIADFADKAEECLLDKVVRGRVVTNRSQGKRLELTRVGIERLLDDPTNRRGESTHDTTWLATRHHPTVDAFAIWFPDALTGHVFHEMPRWRGSAGR